jgi:ethanolamine-phosphate cytidylyltransferase
MDRAYVQHLRDEYRIDYIVHGDDVCVGPDGSDVFATAKEFGMFKVFPRTEGVSTTDILGRTLLLTTKHHCIGPARPTRLSQLPQPITIPGFSKKAHELLQAFSDVRKPRPGQKIVYVDGFFDLFHAGHVKIFEQARAFGDFLLVGVHSDQEAQHQKGGMYPIMNAEERLLAILACRHVDDVLVNAPWTLTNEFVAAHSIDIICYGMTGDVGLKQQEDPYAAIRGRGLLRQVDSGLDLSVEVILNRLGPAREELQQRYLRKSEAEATFWRDKKAALAM